MNKCGDFVGSYVCGESIDIKDDYLISGSYITDHPIKIYDNTQSKLLK